jgi:hypothetical protein
MPRPALSTGRILFWGAVGALILALVLGLYLVSEDSIFAREYGSPVLAKYAWSS